MAHTYVQDLFVGASPDAQKNLEVLMVVISLILVLFLPYLAYKSYQKEKKIKKVYGMPWEETYDHPRT